MSIASMTGVSSTVAAPETRQTDDASSKTEQLQKQLEQIKGNGKLPQAEKEKRIANIEKRIEQVEQQEEKGSSIDPSIELKRRFDTYETQTPQESAGVYKVAHDENGQQIIQVEENQGNVKPQSAVSPQSAAEPQSEAEPRNETEKPTIEKTVGNTDKVDREIKKLKQKKAELQQKIATTEDQKQRESLEKQLAQVEDELKLKDNDTYRRQHMEITEQEAVSKAGE